MRHTFDMARQCDDAMPVGHLAAVMQDYVHPREVLRDNRLDPAEKRAVLCFWASDACAVESRPGFRWLPGSPGPILFDHVIAALQSLDGDSCRDQSKRQWMGAAGRTSQDLHAGA
jgi:hypothetical protein